MKLSKFKLAYIIFLISCVLLSVIFLVYVGIVVKDYDNAQPERAVEAKLTQLRRTARDGDLSEELDFSVFVTPYEQNDPAALESAYKRKLEGTLTYEISAAESGDMTKIYSVMSDGKLIGKLTLKGENTRTSLFFFTMADWSVAEFVPYPAETVYNLEVYCPDEVSVYINGTQPTAAELVGDTEVPVYGINGLLNEPQIKYLRADGTEISYTTDKNSVKPAVYDYSLLLPSGISLTVNGKAASGEPADGGATRYTVREMTKPEVILLDKCGNTFSYNGEASANGAVTTHSVVVPQEFSVKINGISADEICTPWTSAHPDAAQLLKQADVQLPDLKTYEFALLKDTAEVEVTDSTGKVTKYTISYENGLWLNGVSGSDEIPEDISAEIDVLEAAKCWSKFMTNDFGGAAPGLAAVRKYLLSTSDYYDYAKQWATGIDITFLSAHSLDSFSNERVTDFNRYSDTCFSVSVYFEKNMTLYHGGSYAGTRTDTFNSVMYFVYADDTPDDGVDNPHWAIAVMRDVL